MRHRFTAVFLFLLSAAAWPADLKPAPTPAPAATPAPQTTETFGPPPAAMNARPAPAMSAKPPKADQMDFTRPVISAPSNLNALVAYWEWNAISLRDDSGNGWVSTPTGPVPNACTTLAEFLGWIEYQGWKITSAQLNNDPFLHQRQMIFILARSAASGSTPMGAPSLY